MTTRSEEQLGGRARPPAGRRPKLTTDPLARVHLVPLATGIEADNDAEPPVGAPTEPFTPPPQASQAPLLDPLLTSDVDSWPPVPVPEEIQQPTAVAEPGWERPPGRPLPPREARDTQRLSGGSGVITEPMLPLAALEDPVGRADWNEVHALTGRTAVEAHAEPALVLLDAVACRELGQGSVADAASKQRAIRAVAQLMGLPNDSAIALVLASRLLRRPPLSQRQPPAKLSVALVVAGLALGAGAGWLVTRMLF